jgi:two-component system, chemotaxis family, response regulator PixG
MHTEKSITSDEIGLNNLASQFKEIDRAAFSGNLTVTVNSIGAWIFSFRLGRLGWISQEINSVDLDRRNLSLAQLNLSLENSIEVHNVLGKSLDSHVLAQWQNEGSIDKKQWTELISRLATEYLFDIIQFSHKHQSLPSYHLVATGAKNDRLSIISPLVEIEPILKTLIQDWRDWSNDGLAMYAPSLFPTFSHPKQTSKLLSDLNLRQIVLSIDGTRSLRSLAFDRQQDIHTFTKALLPLLESGAIVLSSRSMSKLDRVENPPDKNDVHNNKVAFDRKTDMSVCESNLNIACINDNIFTYQCLEEIFREYGCRSFGIQDQLKIVPGLIQKKPDLIFMDLVMSRTNGYEICEQIRKISSFKHVPIVILTSKDSSRDLAQAKSVGANGFLGKPVQAESVVKILDKYLVACK